MSLTLSAWSQIRLKLVWLHTKIKVEIGVRRGYYTGEGTDSCSALPIGGYQADCFVLTVEDYKPLEASAMYEGTDLIDLLIECNIDG